MLYFLFLHLLLHLLKVTLNNTHIMIMLVPENVYSIIHRRGAAFRPGCEADMLLAHGVRFGLGRGRFCALYMPQRPLYCMYAIAQRWEQRKT